MCVFKDHQWAGRGGSSGDLSKPGHKEEGGVALGGTWRPIRAGWRARSSLLMESVFASSPTP